MPNENDPSADFPQISGKQKLWEGFIQNLDVLKPVFADMAACVRFFSRLPLARLNSLDDPNAVPDFKTSARAAPLAGAFVALPAAACGLLIGYTALPEVAVAILMAAVLALTTGALHEDGLSDVADGFFGGNTAQRRLDIMKDSRIGAFGALALILATLLRVALLTALLQRAGPADAALIFLTAEAVSRASLVWQWQALPAARPEGLAARFGTPTTTAANQSCLIMLVLLLPAALTTALSALALGLAAAAVIAFGTGQLAKTKIGGMTGDVLGAIQQLSGLGFLLGLLMVP